MGNLEAESFYLQGARMMLLRIMDNFQIRPKAKVDKDDAVYLKAELDAILESKENTRKFLEGQDGGYYDWVRDKKGNLVSAKFMFIATQSDVEKLHELQNR